MVNLTGMRKNWKNTCLSVLISASFILSTFTGCENITPESSQPADLENLQRISYDADEEYEVALKTLEEGCDPAEIIRDDTTMQDQKISLIIQGLSDRVVVEKVLEMLEDRHMKATFAVTAMEAAEDDELVKLIQEKGHEIIDNGVHGDTGLEQLTEEEMLYEFASSRKVFSTLLNLPPIYSMLNSTYYTDSICRTATAAGYSRLVSPTSGHFLNSGSFADTKKVQEYLAKITPGTILVYRLQGYIDTVEYEPKEEWKKPAKDYQATVEEVVAKEEPVELDATVTLGWVLDSIEDEEFKLIPLAQLQAMTAEEYVKSLFEGDGIIMGRCYSGVQTMESVTGLSFCGLPTREEDINGILELLEEYEARATFFVSNEEILENLGTLSKLKEAGCSFSTRGENGESLNGRKAYDVYPELISGRRCIQKNLSLRCKYLYSAVEPDDNVLLAAGVAGMSVICPKTTETVEKGGIRCFILDDQFKMEKLEKYFESSKSQKLEIVDITDLLKTADAVIEIEEKTLAELREANGGKKAIKRDFVYTSERALNLSFYGVANEAVLKDVLKILKNRGYQGTFYVSLDDMKKYTDQILMIVEAGHEIGLSYVESEEVPAEFDAVATYILQSQTYAEWKYDTQIQSVFQPYGETTDEFREAISATGCRFAGYEFAMVQSKDVKAKSVGEFYNRYSSKIMARRGSIAYFHMNFYEADHELDPATEPNTLLGSLLKKFISTKIDTLNIEGVGGYRVKTFRDLSSSRYVYYPGKNKQNLVAEGNTVLGSMGDAVAQNNYMAAHYIGNPNVTELPGLGGDELAKFDTTGVITTEKVLFLTFDDWGDESILDPLLAVLKKHGVKANFFIRTNNVSYNPNLLRAIAMDGHMVGSHTNMHMVGAKVEQDEKGVYHFDSLTEEEGLVLRNDVVTAYQTLNYYIGDVVVDGKPALSRIYRPPTLRMSRLSLYHIFDVGYSYVVCGDVSTKDYEIGSLEELLDTFRNGVPDWYGREKVKNGSCIVMHMSPDAIYTAEALDIMIPEWIGQGYSFGRLDDYLK